MKLIGIVITMVSSCDQYSRDWSPAFSWNHGSGRYSGEFGLVMATLMKMPITAATRSRRRGRARTR